MWTYTVYTVTKESWYREKCDPDGLDEAVFAALRTLGIKDPEFKLDGVMSEIRNQDMDAELYFSGGRKIEVHETSEGRKCWRNNKQRYKSHQ